MKKTNFIRLLVLGVVLITSIPQMWADSGYTLVFHCIPKDMFGDNAEYHNLEYRKVSVGCNDQKGDWHEYEIYGTGKYYNGNEIFTVSMNCGKKDDGVEGAKNIWFRLRHAETWATVYAELKWDDWRNKSDIEGYIRTKSGWVAYKEDRVIKSGATVVWDMVDNSKNWSNTYMREENHDGSKRFSSAFTRAGTSSQWHMTYAEDEEINEKFRFFSNNTNVDTYGDNAQTTDITLSGDLTGVTLYSFINTKSGYDLNWQRTDNAKKADSGTKFYFDNSAAKWSEIWLKYGTAYNNHSSAAAATKVNGTDNLYVITLPNDIYYEKYYLANHYGYTNYYSIETMTNISDRIPYHPYNYSADTTFIPTSSSGSSPKVWDTMTKMAGHMHNVTITAPSHGTITVAYTNEGGSPQSPTSGTFAVARTCILTVSATGDTGYDRSSLTINESAHPSGNEYIIKQDITVAATFTPQVYDITYLDYGGGSFSGSHADDHPTSHTFDTETTLKSATKEGYDFGGWYLEEDCSGTVVTILGATEYTSGITLYAKWTAQEYSITYKDKDNATYSGDKTAGVPTGAPTTHTYNSATALVNGTKTGYVFEGWYTESDCESGKVTSLGATTYTADITLYAKWESAATVAARCWADDGTGGYTWEGPASGFDTPQPGATTWSDAVWHSTPNINTQVVLTETMSITGAAIAKEVILPSDKKLDIAAGGSLIVANTVQLSNGSAPSSSNIEISSSLSGNAALIWGADATISADVEFTTLSHGSAGSSASVNQYIGVPTETSVWSYTDSWLFEVLYDGDGNPYWSYMNGGTLEPWKGYSLISMSGSAGSGYTISGELTNEDHVYSGSDLHWTSTDLEGTENLLANSWTAPIRISAFDAKEDFNDVEATIYIFNSNSKDGFDRENPKGNYDSFTPGEESTYVIPSMQSFSVMTNGASPRVSLHYKQLVYEPATKGFNNHANYAPKHSQESEEKKSLKLYVQGTDGWADLLKVYERSDYSPEFENGRDAHKLQGNAAAPHLYGVCSDGKLAINFVPTVDNMVVGFHAGTASNEYTFSFSYDGDDELVLKDTKTGIETPIDNESTYDFTSSSEDSDLRFVVIKKAPQITTAVDDISESNNVQKILHNGALYIVREGRIYDATGALVK